MSFPSKEDARNRLRPFGIVFEKSLTDLIRGIRATKDMPSRLKYLQEAIAECRSEVNSPDMEVKTQAVLKLAYLEMYGFDMSWAAFNVLEVMSSAKFQQKRVGYLAAIQSFRTDTDVLMLTTNLLKKDINSAHHLEISVALGGAASIVTPSLAQDLSDDILKMLNHSKPYIRKKAVLAMYKIFLQFPEALRTSFPRLRDKLSDPDPSVVSATVNVICELAKTNSKNFIVFAPQLYDLLTTSTNNWMLIKILKLFSSLVPQEPRLKAKLLPPILAHIENANAQSILYECINCIVSSGMLSPDDYEVAAICVEKLRMFLESNDQNLKYVGLSALSKIVKIHPQFVFSNEDVILRCVDDPEITIRQRAIDMISGIVTEDNVTEIVTQLKAQLTPDIQTINLIPSRNKNNLTVPRSYRITVIRRIIEFCSKDMYKCVPDFDWYISILVELLTLADGADEVAGEIGYQLRDIAVRVVEMRDTVVVAATNICSRQYIYSKMPSVLPAVLWVLGEYAKYIASPVETIYFTIQFLQSLAPEITGAVADSANNVNVSVVTIGIQTLAKIFSVYGSMTVGWTSNRAEVVETVTHKLVKFFDFYSTSLNFEIQERATEFLELFKLVQEALQEHPADAIEAPGLLTIALPSLFEIYEMNPVAPGSQFHIPIPADLDLDTEINPSYGDSDDDEIFGEEEEDWDVIGGGGIDTSLVAGMDATEQEWKSSVAKIVMTHENENSEEALRRKLERIERQRDDPFYISEVGAGGAGADSRSFTPDVEFKSSVNSSQTNLLDLDSVPIKQLDITGSNFAMKRKPKTKVSIIRDEVVPGSPASPEGGSQGTLNMSSNPRLPQTPANAIRDKSVQKFQSAFRGHAAGLQAFDLHSPEPEETEIEKEVQRLREAIAIPKTKTKKKSKSSKSEAGDGSKKSKKKSSSKKSSEGKEKEQSQAVDGDNENDNADNQKQETATGAVGDASVAAIPDLLANTNVAASPTVDESLANPVSVVVKKKKKTKARKAVIE